MSTVERVIYILISYAVIATGYLGLNAYYSWKERKGLVTSKILRRPDFCCKYKLPQFCFISKICTIIFFIIYVTIKGYLLITRYGNSSFFDMYIFVGFWFCTLPATSFGLYAIILSEISYRTGKGYIYVSPPGGRPPTNPTMQEKAKRKQIKASIRKHKWLLPLLKEIRSFTVVNRKGISYIDFEDISNINNILIKYEDKIYSELTRDKKGREIYKVFEIQDNRCIFWARVNS